MELRFPQLPVRVHLARVQVPAHPCERERLERSLRDGGTRFAAWPSMVQLLAVLALLFSLADHWTTYLCLRVRVAGWQVTEANPIAGFLFQRFGLAGGLWIDTFVTAAILLVLVRTPRLARPVKLAALAVLIATTAYAVANNLQAVQVLGLSLTGSAG